VRYVELFAGAGGLSMGLRRAGMTCLAHAEIEPHACGVLRARWPGVDLLGNVIDAQWLLAVDAAALGLA
jgi:DNA (cytosine-5)-methyltransferase 1